MPQHDPSFEAKAGVWRDIYVPALPEPAIDVDITSMDHLPEPGTTGLEGFRAQVAGLLNELGVDGLPITTPPPRIETNALFSIPAQRLMKADGEAAVKDLAARLGQSGDVETETNGAFINISFSPQEIGATILDQVFDHGDVYGASNVGEGKTVVMDVSSPNIAKEMHLGHLRSTVIGEALRRIMMFNGYNVIRDNHVGDWGTQFGLLGRAVEMWGDEVADLLSSDDSATQVKGLLHLYVKINKQVAEEKELSEDGATSQLENDARAWFVRLEQGDEDAREFWQYASALSMLEFDEIYKELGCEFEYIIGESVYNNSNQPVIKAFKEAGLTFVDDKGVVKVTPSKQKGDALGIQKPDGGSLYGTRDLATIAARMHWFNPDKIVYVVGSDQNEYFVNLFDAMQRYIDEPGVLDLVHVSFGPVEGAEGPMSTRKGTVVAMRDVIQLLKESVRPRVVDNFEKHSVEVDEEDIERITSQVAVGALIHYDLKGASKRKIVYDPEEITTFEGNTGPHLQYTLARINSLLDKSEYDGPDDTMWEFTQDDTVVNDIIHTLGELPQIVRKAAEKYEPYLLTEYLYGLTGAFNRLWVEENIQDNDDPKRRAMLLDLASATRQVLSTGLKLLNIPQPERM